MAVFSTEFRPAYEAWIALHGFAATAVFVPHPIQPRSDAEMIGLADAAFAQVIAGLTA